MGSICFGCALFVDLLTPCTILSKVIQSDDLDILGVLSSLLRSVKEIEKLSSTYFGVIPCQINKEFWVTSWTLTKQKFQRLKTVDRPFQWSINYGIST